MMFKSYGFARAHVESTNNGMIIVLKFSIHVIYLMNNIIIKKASRNQGITHARRRRRCRQRIYTEISLHFAT